jgi:hypothetical protein
MHMGGFLAVTRLCPCSLLICVVWLTCGGCCMLICSVACLIRIMWLLRAEVPGVAREHDLLPG